MDSQELAGIIERELSFEHKMAFLNSDISEIDEEVANLINGGRKSNYKPITPKNSTLLDNSEGKIANL